MKTKQARALVDLSLYGCPAGGVLDAAPKIIAALVDAGHADDGKEAIAAAKADGAKTYAHDAAAADAESAAADAEEAPAA